MSLDDNSGYRGTGSIPMGDGNDIALYQARKVKYTIVRSSGDSFIVRSFQDGDMGETQKTNADITPMSDPQGSTAAALNNDNLGTLQLNIREDSPNYSTLITMYRNHEVFGIHQTDDYETTGANHALINKAPTAAFGKTVPIRQLTINLMDYDIDVQDPS